LTKKLKSTEKAEKEKDDSIMNAIAIS